ncbi:cellulase family glycosylhydrolase [Paraconexibacter antarcticus]|uniref:Cellulase family glycosylhydrolase n=1 Tax=Paraconexibacter antarcticus TaxID=2949664 RepID=A0ABY5DTT9_9ACTN|nr:cellulase family glycosylhydrolase [Paraconexibacter antarcticus]UTI65448.1 cellulase family glycosylhydrolase [Paraconexibacter antarcticus]
MSRLLLRHPARRGLLVALLLLAVAVAPTAAHAAVSGPFGHKGRWLTDVRGRTLVLHGVNMVYKRPPYTVQAAGFGADDADFLKAEGLDTVRLGVIWKALEPRPGVYDDAYVVQLHATVDLLRSRGIATLLDAHQDLYNERFQGEGAPDWAVRDDGLPAAPMAGFPGNYLVMPALQRAFDHFWDDDAAPGDTTGLQERFAAAWAHLAASFRGDPGVLGLELFNEPWPGSTWQACLAPAGCPGFEGKLTAFTRRVTAAIRAVDPRVLVFYEPQPLFNDGTDTALGPIGDPHAVFAFHDYCLSASNTGSDIGCAPFDDLVFRHAEARATRTGDGLFMTEFGSTDATDVLTHDVERADRAMVGWQYWSYCACAAPTDTGGEGAGLVRDPAVPPSGANIKPAKLLILARPHPRAVAGTLSSFGWDGTTLRAAWTPGPGDDSELAVPSRSFPRGYGVRVTGGEVTSAAGAAVLHVRACPGATAVRVAVSATDLASAGACAPRFGLALRVRHARLRPGRPALVTLRVTRATGGAPVAGARVTLGGRLARTDAHGVARLRVRAVPRGGLRLRVTAPGARPRVLRLAAGSRREVRTTPGPGRMN